MSFYERFVSYSKGLTILSITILSVGIFFIPSEEEKIRKMKVSDISLSGDPVWLIQWLSFLQARQVQMNHKPEKSFNVSQMNRNVSTNEKSESINVFKDL